jgi:hypothetical protein
MRDRSLMGIVLAFLLLGGSWGVAAAEPIFRALEFDGVDDFVTVPYPIALPNGPLTVEAWVWMSSADPGGRIVSNRFGANGYEFDVYPADAGQFEVRLSFNGSVMASGFYSGQAEQWTHLAGTWAGSALEDLSLYANGELIGSSLSGVTIEAPIGSLHIGSSGNEGLVFGGVLDDVRIWSVALDKPTIQTWMNKPVDDTHPNFSHLEGYWKFDEGAGQVAASFVHSPERDGQLGSTPEVEDSDPVWTTNVAPVPTDPTTFGRFKWGFR